MAEKRVIEIEVKENFKQVEKDLDNLNESLRDTSENNRDVRRTFAEVYGELQPLTARMGEAEDRLYELAAAGQTTTQEYRDLLNTVASYRRVQMQTDMVVDAASSTFATKLTGAVNGAVSAYSIAEGATALMGVESEKLQETMVKLQAAMSISQGLMGLKEGGIAFKQLGQSAMTALKGIRGALAATGIGLFLVALGTIVAYWDDIKSAVSGVTSEQEKLNEISKAKFETSKAELENLDAQDNILKLQGKSEREILNLKIAKVNTAIEDGKINLQNVIKTSKAEEEAAIKNYNLTKRIVDFILDTALFLPKLMLMPIDMAIKGANKVSEALGFGKLIAFDMGKTMEDMQDKFTGFIAGSIFNVEEIKSEGEKSRKELEKEIIGLENQKAEFQNTIKEMDKGAAQTAIDTKKAELDALIELEIRKDQTDKKRLEDLLAERLKLEKLKGNQLLLAEQDNAEKVRKAIEEDNSEVIKLETKKLDTLKVLRDSKLEGLKGSLNAEVEAEKQAAEHKQKVLEAQAVRAQKLEENSQAFRVKAVQESFSIITDLAAQSQAKYEALNKAVLDNDKLTDSEKQKLLDANNKKAKKAFDIQKAANIASALITTYQSATSAYASQFVPVPDPSSPIRGGIAAGLAVAAGLANVKRIASQKFEGASLSGGSSSGGGSVPDAGTMQAPNFSVIGSSGVNQLAQLQQQPTKAYVVSGEVTSQQALDRNRVQNATL